MKKYGILAATLITTCLAAITLSRAQVQWNSKSTPADVKASVQELSSSEPEKRAVAACSLGKMGARAEPAIPALISLLGDGAHVDPKLICYREFYSEVNTEPQYEVKEPSPGEAAAQGLIGLGEPAVEPLIAALKDSRWRTRKNAVWALSYLRDPRAFKSLLEAAKDEAWQVRAFAALGLGRQRGEGGVEQLIVDLNDQNAAVRWFAALSLGLLRDTRAVEPLTQALKDQHPTARSFAALSLGQLRDHRAVTPLIEALKDENNQVRMHAALSLGELGDRRAIPPLTEALKDESDQVRNNARIALSQIKK